MSTPPVPELLWEPTPELREDSEMARLMRDVGAEDYQALHAWSVQDIGRFWREAVWDRFEVLYDGSPEPALADARMPGARWFPNARLSFPEHVFRGKDDADAAIHAAGEDRETVTWTWGDLREQTARIRAGLVAMGVQEGDRVVGYLPHVPETVAAFLAVSSLGATWSCCSPDFGSSTVVDRFAQIEPKVLLAVESYRYSGKTFDRSATVTELEAALPSLVGTVRLDPFADGGGEDWSRAFGPTDAPLEFARVPFDHPLWVLYSSGTTGLPKAIVHGHGGIVLEHLKTWRLQHDARPGDRVLWFTTTGWVMWNYLVAGLMTEASIVLFDGNPGYPDMGALWDVCDEVGVTVFGTGAAYLHGCLKAGLKPKEGRDLSPLRAIGSTGSPLSPEGFRWVYDELGEHIWLFSASGGTDIAGAFVGASPVVPVHLGELQAKGLGVDVQAWDDNGNELVDEVGELVVTQPMPSMPTKFWNDDGDARYRESYYEHYDVDPPVWRHGDWIRITPRGSSVIYGRSDSTINRGGIRMGTAEIYAAVLAMDEIADALVVDVPPLEGTGDARMVMFVVLADGASLDDALVKELRAQVRSACSPRHVPDEIHVVDEVPRTLTGKVLEVPVKKLLMGQDPDRAASRDALANPDAFGWFVDFAKEWTAAPAG